MKNLQKTIYFFLITACLLYTPQLQAKSPAGTIPSSKAITPPSPSTPKNIKKTIATHSAFGFACLGLGTLLNTNSGQKENKDTTQPTHITDSLHTQNGNLSSQLASINTQNQELNQQNSQLQDKISILQSQLNTQDAKHPQKNRINQLTNQLGKEVQKIRALETQKTQLSSQNNNLESQLSTAQSNNQAKSREATSLKDQLDNQKEATDQLENQLKDEKHNKVH
ncbi:MAG: hypothetical protein AAF380_01220, partial [Bacteroidota bacterium]